MGALSAVALVFFLVFFGLVGVAAISASPHVVGTIAIVAGIVVAVDVFWHHWGQRNPG